MKYLILGKSEKKGVSGNDSIYLNVYFELGWEIAGSRFDFIKLLKTKKIGKDVTIVTTEERMFFYTKIYDKVISYEDFRDMKLNPEDTVEDWPETNSKGVWTSLTHFNFLRPEYFVAPDGRYLRHDEDYEEIFNGFDLSRKTIEKPKEKYILLGLRLRDHNSYANFDLHKELYISLINKLKSQVTDNIFVLGFGSEDFCKQHQLKYLEHMVDFVYLVKDRELCYGSIMPGSGAAMLSMISSEAPLYLLDYTNRQDITGNNAVLGGKCIHFINNKILKYTSLNNQIFDDIINDML